MCIYYNYIESNQGWLHDESSQGTPEHHLLGSTLSGVVLEGYWGCFCELT